MSWEVRACRSVEELRAAKRDDVDPSTSAVALTASVLQTLFPGVCDDATPERVLKLLDAGRRSPLSREILGRRTGRT